MKVTANEQRIIRMEFNLDGLSATFDDVDQRLTLDMPGFGFDGPVLTENARDALQATGLTQRQIDEALEEMMDNLQCKVLAQILLQRRR